MPPLSPFIPGTTSAAGGTGPVGHGGQGVVFGPGVTKGFVHVQCQSVVAAPRVFTYKARIPLTLYPTALCVI